jgi:hypothetical protein
MRREDVGMGSGRVKRASGFDADESAGVAAIWERLTERQIGVAFRPETGPSASRGGDDQ